MFGGEVTEWFVLPVELLEQAGVECVPGCCVRPFSAPSPAGWLLAPLASVLALWAQPGLHPWSWRWHTIQTSSTSSWNRRQECKQVLKVSALSNLWETEVLTLKYGCSFAVSYWFKVLFKNRTSKYGPNQMWRDVTSVIRMGRRISDGQIEGSLPANCVSFHVVCNLGRYGDFHKDMENILQWLEQVGLFCALIHFSKREGG